MSGRIRAVGGGTSASKTISILVWLIAYCQSTPNELCSVVSESYPHLERGAMLDFENIMKDRNYWKDSRWHGSKHVYTFETGSKLEFFSPDTYGKAHGPRRDILFLNECNNLDFKIVDQLMVRTRKIVWMDWNPTFEFWFYTDLLVNRKNDIDFITLTYKDNEALDVATINEIESHKHNKNWWTVYGLGQLGAVEGRIYKDWQTIPAIPHEARLERRGLDFGYSNDPTAIVAIYYYNGGYILDEEVYSKGLSNRDIADRIKLLPHPETLIIADSAEPKSIDELKLYDLGLPGELTNPINIFPAVKGQNSIKTGIGFVQQQKISVTARSLNLLREFRNYMWLTDKDGRVLNEPMGGKDHCMDALRYAFNSVLAPANYITTATVTYPDDIG